MIREYYQYDLENFNHNQFSDPSSVGFVFDDESWQKFSLVDGDTQCIICVKHMGNWEWGGFFLISKGFKMAHVRQLKWFMENGIRIYKPKRLWTLSADHKVIEKWHKLLGMKREKSQIMNGKKYYIWAMEW